MNEHNSKQLRFDHYVISKWIDERSRVLDLGCGNGDLLAMLIKEKEVHGTGIEIDEQAIYKCVEKGLSVSHGDIDSSLGDYSSKRFDYVILSESLQQVLHPENVIMESLRIGKKVIVGIPNFGHINARYQLFFQGRVPVTEELPDQWYNTPNLRFLTIKDFRVFCAEKGITVLEEKALMGEKEIKWGANLLANVGLFLLEKT